MSAPVSNATEGNALTDTFVLWKRQVTRFFNNPLKIVAMAIRPLIWLGLFGVAMQTVAPPINGRPYAVYILPGIVAMGVLSMASRGGQTLLRDKNTGFLKEVLVAPVSRTSVLLGFCLGITTRSLVNSVLMILAGYVLGVSLGGDLVTTAANILLLLVVLSLLSLALVSLSCALAWIIEDLVTYSIVSGWFFYPLFFLSGALFKVKGLPIVLYTLVQLNPLTYGVDAVRQIMLGPEVGAFSFTFDLIFVTAFAAASLAFALWTLSRAPKTD